MLCGRRAAGVDVLAHLPFGGSRRRTITSINANWYVAILTIKE